MKILLAVAGVVNSLFVLFHIFLGYQLHRTIGLSDPVRGLLETFNACGTLAILLLACAFLLRGREVLRTGLGAALLAFGALLYLTRAGAEFVFLTGNLGIAGVCVAVGLLHAVALAGVRIPKQTA
jgi:hypothetical protein